MRTMIAEPIITIKRGSAELSFLKRKRYRTVSNSRTEVPISIPTITLMVFILCLNCSDDCVFIFSFFILEYPAGQ
nr:hypothetical protein [uncultured Allomuricauda sp.]